MVDIPTKSHICPECGSELVTEDGESYFCPNPSCVTNDYSGNYDPYQEAVMSTIHLCNSCLYSFPTCTAKEIVWGIDVNPKAKGSEADTVLKCDTYYKTTRKESK